MARSCESFCCKKNKYCNVFVSTFTTTNECEAREKIKSWLRFRKHPISARRGKKIMATLQKTTNQCEARLGGEYKRWEVRECERALQNAGKHTNSGTSRKACTKY